jgi:hypothetical protein
MEQTLFVVTCGNWEKEIIVNKEGSEPNLFNDANEAMTRAIEKHYNETGELQLAEFITAKDKEDGDPYNTVVCLTANVLRFASKHKDAEEMEAFFE